MEIRPASVAEELIRTVHHEYAFLAGIPEALAAEPPGKDRWSIKQTVGHLIDSASNNHQRMVRLQYTERLRFPDYTKANESWVSIQAYQNENWQYLLELWKYFNLHIAHVIQNADGASLLHTWLNDEGEGVSLESMFTGYLEHFALHLRDIHMMAETNSP